MLKGEKGIEPKSPQHLFPAIVTFQVLTFLTPLTLRLCILVPAIGVPWAKLGAK
jgi:hypothetical protein